MSKLIHKIDETVQGGPCRCCGNRLPWYMRIVRTVRCGRPVKRTKGSTTWKSGRVNCKKCLKLQGVGPKRSHAK